MNNLARRHFKEKIFKACGLLAITLSCLFLMILLVSISIQSYGAFFNHKILIDIVIPSNFDNTDHRAVPKLIEQSILTLTQSNITPSELVTIYNLFSISALDEIEAKVKDLPPPSTNFSIWVTASSKLARYLDQKKNPNNPNLSSIFIQKLEQELRIKKIFTWRFLTDKESREPELAGIMSGLIGSLYLIMVCIVIAFPLGVLTAIYLEEFAPKNKLTYFVEININNLAAVPSIIFGLLGLAIYIGVCNLPRSSPLVGGMTLALMVLPTIVVTTRSAIKAVPLALKESMMALGASDMQIIFSLTLPLALPGIITGAILSFARAIGETAPLMIIGMVAFIVDVPSTIFDPATAIPIQIYLWSESPEYGFMDKTSAAILMLLILLIIINMSTIFIRKRFQHKW